MSRDNRYVPSLQRCKPHHMSAEPRLQRQDKEEQVMKRKERRYSDYETAHYYAMRQLSERDNIKNIRIDKSNNEWILSWFERNESLPDSFNAFWENHFRDVSRAEMRNDPGFT